MKVEIDRNIINVLDILNKIFIMHMRDMESVIFLFLHEFDVINDALH